MSLALSSSCNYSILALVAVSFVWGVKILIISLSEVFVGLAVTLPATVFHGIMVGMLGNSG